MTLTIATSNALASHLYRNDEFPSPQVWLGFLDNVSQELLAITNPGYARVRLDDKMGAPDQGLTTSIADLVFSPATSAWVTTITSVGIWDSQTSGQLLQEIILPSPINVDINESVRFVAGQIILGFGNILDGYYKNGILGVCPDDRIWITSSFNAPIVPSS